MARMHVNKTESFFTQVVDYLQQRATYDRNYLQSKASQIADIRGDLHINFTQSTEQIVRLLEGMRGDFDSRSFYLDFNTTAFVKCVTLDDSCVQDLSLYVQYQEIVAEYARSKSDILRQYA